MGLVESGARGIISRIFLGPMVHTGPNGYLDPSAALGSGQSHLEGTLEVMSALITDTTETVNGR